MLKCVCVMSHLLWYTVLYLEVRITQCIFKSLTLSLYKQKDASEAQSHALSQQDLISRYTVV